MSGRSLVMLVGGAAFAAAALACSDEPASTTHATIEALDEAPLAILAHGDTVYVANAAELVRLDARDGTRTRLTDGRYRECPWRPWQQWEEPLAIAPRLTPEGDFLTMNAMICGSWAWSTRGAAPIALARSHEGSYPEAMDETRPAWAPVTSIAVARDGDGWLACGKREQRGTAELWSLSMEGAPRERLATALGECASLDVDAGAIYATIGDAFSRFDRAANTWTPLAPAPRYVAGATESHFVLVYDDHVDRVARAGGAPEAIVVAAPGCSYGCFAAAVDATHVYFTDSARIARAAHADIARVEEVARLPEGVRVHLGQRLPTLAVTSTAIWAVTLEGQRERQPFLSKFDKPIR